MVRKSLVQTRRRAAESSSARTLLCSYDPAYRNPNFEAYYKAQGIVPESEWSAFMDALCAPLPTTFRINPCDVGAEVIRRKLLAMAADADSPLKIRPIPWLGGGADAWHCDVGRTDMRKTPELKSFHRWLTTLTDAGCVSRQEAVSFIPPLFMHTHADSVVMDMCASPGSKTEQILESMHADAMRLGREPAGFIVANDNNHRRAFMLVHQCQRVPSANLLVSCHDAQAMPVVLSPPDLVARAHTHAHAHAHAHAGSADASDGPRDELRKRARSAEPTSEHSAAAAAPVPVESDAPARVFNGVYDRVLCDVPCSGDGTARKNGDVMTKWSPVSGLVLHPTQVMIAMRGLHQLRPNGLMVYSTCSFNPVENEAVVAEVLRRCRGCVELVDVSSSMPSLLRSPGLSLWCVHTLTHTHGAPAGLARYDTYEASQARDASGRIPKACMRLTPSLFPPSAEEAADMHLHRCMRFLPHTQNTGGFFVAVLRKTAPLPKDVQMRRPVRPFVPRPGAAPATGSASVSAAPSPADDAAAAALDEAGDAVDDENDAGDGEDAADAADAAAAADGDDGAGGDVAGDGDDDDAAPAAAAAQAGDKRQHGRDDDDKRKADEYCMFDPEAAKAILAFYGIDYSTFPLHRLLTRPASSRVALLVSESIVQHFFGKALPRAADGREVQVPSFMLPRMRIVNLGVKLFQTGMGGTEEVTAHTWRAAQDGLQFLLPFFTRQVAFVSGKEFAMLLQTAPKQLAPAELTPRLRAGLATVDYGSFAMVLTPLLDGHEADLEAYPAPDSGTSGARLHRVMHLEGARAEPRKLIAGEDLALVPPALRSCYVAANAAGEPQPAVDCAAPTHYAFQPTFRGFLGFDLLAKCQVVMWRGKQRYNVMADKEGIAVMMELLREHGEYMHRPVEPPVAPAEAAPLGADAPVDAKPDEALD